MSDCRSTFLLEIGTEEIPARMIDGALGDLAHALLAGLNAARLLPGGDWTLEKNIKVYGTPRRLAAHVERLLARQPDLVAEVTGPPVKTAFDATGKPTRAAEGFARAQGVELQDLIRTSTPKGEVLAARRNVPGRAARTVLAEIIPPLVASLYFPKTMRWGRGEHRFVRPIHTVVALLDSDIVDLAIAGVRAGRETFGHRFAGRAKITLREPAEYVGLLRQNHVLADIPERRQKIEELLRLEAERVSGEISTPPGHGHGRGQGDPELLDEVTQLVEWPTVISGEFDPAFLELPADVLITAMRHHQKYFSLWRSGQLMNRFLAVANTTGDPSGSIRRGNEWVLRARLTDARFFLEEDRKTPLAARASMLDRVTFHEKLGSYANKIRRMSRLAEALRPAFAGMRPTLDYEAALSAIALSKNDLTTQVVNEFPELEGIVGGLYAKADGHRDTVWMAIYTHYLPRGTDDTLPETLEGLLVSLADRFDSQTGIFLIGIVPTGSRDPYALRRSVQGVCRILIEGKIHLSLESVLDQALKGYDGQVVAEAVPRAQALAALLEFYRGRQQNLGEAAGLSADAVRAALTASGDDPFDARLRMQALDAARHEAGFEDLANAHKRIKNILKAQPIGVFDPGRLREKAEKVLHADLERVVSSVRGSLDKHDHRAVLREIDRLRPSLDRFFGEVMVMAEERPLRENRLALLNSMAALFMKVGDFSELVHEAEPKEGTRRSRA